MPPIYTLIVSVAALAVTVLTVALVQRALLARVDALLAAQAREREAWRIERSELLTRIQHPQIIVPPPSLDPPAPLAPAEDDEIDMVGTISLHVPELADEQSAVS